MPPLLAPRLRTAGAMAALSAIVGGLMTAWGWWGGGLPAASAASRPTGIVALFCILLSVLVLFSLLALRRHVLLGRALAGSHVARYAGLVWALVVWSASSFWFSRREMGDLPWSALVDPEFLYPFTLRLLVALPFCLYGGLLFVWVVRRGALGGGSGTGRGGRGGR